MHGQTLRLVYEDFFTYPLILLFHIHKQPFDSIDSEVMKNKTGGN